MAHLFVTYTGKTTYCITRSYRDWWNYRVLPVVCAAASRWSIVRWPQLVWVLARERVAAKMHQVRTVRGAVPYTAGQVFLGR